MAINFGKWKSKFFGKEKAKKRKAKKEGQQDFFEDYEESKKETDSKFGFAEGTSFSKRKRKEDKKEAKARLNKMSKAKADRLNEERDFEAKKSFRSGANVEVLSPRFKKYPSKIAVKVPKPEDTKYVTIDLKNADVLLTKSIPEGTTRKDNVKIVQESDTKPKLDDIKIIGAKIKILDSGTVVYDKTPLKGQKTGFVKASFKGLGSTGKGLKGYGAKLKKKAGRGFNIEF